MGRLKFGKWMIEGMIPNCEDGEFKREDAKFRNVIEEGGKYPPEAGRYHLYISLASPWACRAFIMMKLKKIEGIISMSIVNPHVLEQGWSFIENFSGVIPDIVLNKKYLYQVYQKADPLYSGKVTVPVLFDKKTNTIVNNESSEIIRMMNTVFNKITGDSNDFYPEALRSEINQINSFIYDNINNGVYKVGFAANQDVYNKNVKSLFEALDKIEEKLEGKETLVGMILTEADVRLFTTLVRFDSVYYLHFKCNIKMIREYKNLSRYLSNLYYNVKAFNDTTNFDHIKEHYYFSHKQLNPGQIVPLGPNVLIPEIKLEKEKAEVVQTKMPKQESIFDEAGAP